MPRKDYESRLAYNREYYHKNKERARELGRLRSQKYRDSKPEAQREASKAWRERNPEWVRSNNAKRRAAGVMDAEWTSILMQDPCVYCGTMSMHIDHITPVSKDGTNDWNNLAPTCAACNLSKGADSWWEFMLRRPDAREFT